VLLAPLAVAATYAAVQLGAWVGEGLRGLGSPIPPFPAIPFPPFRLPGTTFVDEAINPCYLPGPNLSRPTPWHPRPFSLSPRFFGPLPGFNSNPISIPNVSIASSGVERHHLLPRQFRPEFEAASLDIEDYVVELPRDSHKDVHGRGGGDAWINSWNQQWKRFFQRNPNASSEEILQQLESMKRGFGIP
jgi:hypothetical protein